MSFKKCGLPWAERQAVYGAPMGTQTDVSFILSQDADAHRCAAHFLHGLDAPCYDLATRRAYALATLYVDDLLRGVGGLYPIDREVLIAILRSSLRMRRSTAVHVIFAMVEEGLLVASDSVGVI